jgi:hypothetical protein
VKAGLLDAEKGKATSQELTKRIKVHLKKRTTTFSSKLVTKKKRENGFTEAICRRNSPPYVKEPIGSSPYAEEADRARKRLLGPTAALIVSGYPRCFSQHREL